MALFVSRLLLPTAALALLVSPVLAQRPTLTGEKATVAEAVKADLARLAELQNRHHERTRVYAADARDLSFSPSSGAQVSIAYASMNAWAANATHPVLSPIACFIIISSAEPTGPAAAPFCQEGRPGTGTTVASGQPTTPSATAPRIAPPSAAAPAAGAAPPTAGAPSAGAPAATTVTTPATPARSTPPRSAPAAPAASAGAPGEIAMTPTTPAAPLPAPGAAPAPSGPTTAALAPGALIPDAPRNARAGTRETDPAGAPAAQQAENVTAAQFAQRLNQFAQGVPEIFVGLPAELARITKDPYESTAEFEARRAAAIAAAERREREFLAQNTKTYNVSLPVKEVRYDADREVLEFTVDGIGLPMTRVDGEEPTLTFSCYTRPVFWCASETGMTYEAGDLWRVPRSVARQHDVLRTPLTLYARFTVGRREDSRTLAISLLSMDLQARGQSVQRWDGASR
jgi:hypothetical protein